MNAQFKKGALELIVLLIIKKKISMVIHLYKISRDT